jgi:UDP-N-acetylmuramate-alanine ligase
MADEGDLILTLGAGNVSQLGPLILAELEKVE